MINIYDVLKNYPRLSRQLTYVECSYHKAIHRTTILF